MAETRKSTDKDKELPKRDDFQGNPYITRVISDGSESALNHNEERINFVSRKWSNYFIFIIFAILFLIILLQGKEISKIKDTLKHNQETTTEKVMENVVSDKKK